MAGSIHATGHSGGLCEGIGWCSCPWWKVGARLAPKTEDGAYLGVGPIGPRSPDAPLESGGLRASHGKGSPLPGVWGSSGAGGSDPMGNFGAPGVCPVGQVSSCFEPHGGGLSPCGALEVPLGSPHGHGKGGARLVFLLRCGTGRRWHVGGAWEDGEVHSRAALSTGLGPRPSGWGHGRRDTQGPWTIWNAAGDWSCCVG